MCLKAAAGAQKVWVCAHYHITAGSKWPFRNVCVTFRSKVILEFGLVQQKGVQGLHQMIFLRAVVDQQKQVQEALSTSEQGTNLQNISFKE